MLRDMQDTMILVGPETVELRRVSVPSPGAGELLVQVRAATTCGTDVKVFRRGGHPRMLKAPTPFGHELAGTIVATGSGVEDWRVGARVVVVNSAPCGVCEFCDRAQENLCIDLKYLNGAFSEYILVPPRFVSRSTYCLPEGLPFEIGALTEPLACVLHGVEACGLLPNSDVLIFGGGPIGLLFVGVLAVQGHRVVLADPNSGRLEVARRLGAACTVEIDRGGAQAERVLLHARRGRAGAFDVAIDATGVPEVWADAVRVVRPGGVVNLFGGCAPGTTLTLDTTLLHYHELTIKGVYHHRPATAREALSMLAADAFASRELLSAERPLTELVEALRSMMRKETLKVVMRP